MNKITGILLKLKTAAIKHKYLLIGILVVFFIWISFVYYEQRDKIDIIAYNKYVVSDNGDVWNKTEPLTMDSKITQTFKVRSDVLQGIRVYFDINNTTKNDEVMVKVTDVATGKVVANQEVYLEILEENQVEVLFDQTQKDTYNKSFEIEITPVNITNDAKIALLTTWEDYYYDGNLTINGEHSEDDLYVVQLLQSPFFINKLYAILVTVSLFVIIISFLLVYSKKLKPEGMFFGLIIAVGILFFFVFTPHSIPDEKYHFTSAYFLSNTILGVDDAEQGKLLMREADTLDGYMNEDVSPKTYLSVYQDFFGKVEENNYVPVVGEKVIAFQYFYLPGAVGITLGRLLHLSFYMMFYLGRLCSLLTFATFAYFAIKRMPFGKLLMGSIMLMPIVIQQIASYSYDCIILGLSFLTIAQMLHMFSSEETITWKDIIFVCILSALLAPAKGGSYLPLCFLILIVSNQKFKTPKIGWIVKGSVLSSAILTFVINYKIVASQIVTSDHMVTWTSTPTSTFTITDIITSPKWFVKILLMSLIGNSDFYFNTLWGIYMGSFQQKVSLYFIVAIILFLLLGVIDMKEDKVQIALWKKLFIIFLCCGVIVLVFTGMLIGWTPNTSTIIEGVQGRYFLPILPLVLILFAKGNKILTLNTKVDKFVTIGMVMVNVIMMIFCFSEFIFMKY